MNRILITLTAFLMGCDVLEPEPTLQIAGTVRSTAGTVIQGARVQLRFRAFLSRTTSWLGFQTTDAAGAFRFDVGPPPGYSAPNCATMRLIAEADGHWASGEVSFGSGSCDGMSAVEGIRIVLAAHEALVITTTTLPLAIATVPYHEVLEATGGGTYYTWSMSSGTLPSGLSLMPAGFISGATTASGTYDFTVRVTAEPGQVAEQLLSITVVDGVVLQPAELCSDYSESAIPTFANGGLRDAVRAAVGVGPTEPLTCGGVEGVAGLDASSEGIDNLTGIQNLTSLTVLDLSGNQLIADITLLSRLATLTELDLAGVYGVTDISPVGGLTELTKLSLSGMTTFDGDALRDISVLSGLTKLTELNAGSNQIDDLGSLSALTSLTTLDLSWNRVENVSPLSGLSELTTLDLGANSISTVSSLSGLSSLVSLDLRSNPLTDVSGLSSLSALAELDLSANYRSLRDISPLSGLTNLISLDLSVGVLVDIGALSGLTALATLDLGQNSIVDIGPLAGLTALEHLDLEENDVADIGALVGLIALLTLDLGINALTDVSALESLTALTDLNLAGNGALADIQPLLDNPGIGAGDWVGLSATGVSCSDVDVLRAKGVFVGSTCP